MTGPSPRRDAASTQRQALDGSPKNLGIMVVEDQIEQPHPATTRALQQALLALVIAPWTIAGAFWLSVTTTAWGQGATDGGDQRLVPARHLVAFADGTRWEARQLTDWNAPQTQPRLDGRVLDQAGGPWIWWVDRSVPAPTEPTAYLEMHFGDRLPGVATQAANVGGQIRWLVQPAIDLRAPGWSRSQVLRISAAFVRRIVWRPVTDGYQPGLVVRRDGRTWRARSLELGESEVRLLSDQGVIRVPYAELAELHLLESDPWSTYAQLCRQYDPALEGRMWHWSCHNGLRITASAKTFAVARIGHSWRSETWIHALQPVWSDQPLWVRCQTIGWRRSFEPLSVPLTLVPTTLETGAQAVIDRNARGGWLAIGSSPLAWGWGTVAPSRFSIPVPPEAASLSLGWGLDRVGRQRGAATGRVLLRGPPSQSVQELISSGELPGVMTEPAKRVAELPARTGAAQLVFEVDPLDAAPLPSAPGAVADFWDWLEPQVTLARDAWLQRLSEMPAN